MVKNMIIFLLAIIFLFSGCTLNNSADFSSSYQSKLQQSENPVVSVNEEELIKAESILKEVINKGANKESIEALTDFSKKCFLSGNSFYSDLSLISDTLIDYSNGGEKKTDFKVRCENIISQNNENFNLTLLDFYMLAAACIERGKLKNSVALSFAGDSSFGTYPQAPESLKFEPVVTKNPDYFNYPFKNCLAFFNSDSMTILNNEAAISTRTKMVAKEWQIKSDPKFTKMYVHGGVETVNLANNHTKDCFEDGYKDTLKSLDENNIKYFDDGKPLITTVDGIDFVFLGYDMRYRDASDSFRDRIISDIKKHKKSSNILLLSMHWGLEYNEQPTDYQKNYGRAFIDAGADAVIGGHPHIMQGIELYKEKYIIYSMGDFCFGGDPELLSRMTAVFKLYINKSTKKISLNVIPFYENSDGKEKGSNNYQPTPQIDEEADKIIGYLKRISEPLKYGLKEIPRDMYF